MQHITEDVYTFTGLVMGHVYLLTKGDGLTIIDAGLGLAAPRIVQQLTKAGYRPSEVRRILITHAHPDHIGGLPELQRLTGAEVWCSAEEKPVVEGQSPMLRPPRETLSGIDRMMAVGPSMRFPATPVSRIISGGEVLSEVLDGLHVIATPGHAPGHVSFYNESRGLLITGDVIFHMPWGMTEPMRAFSPDPVANRRSTLKIAELKPAIICFGHGTPITQNAAAILDAHADKVRKRL